MRWRRLDVPGRDECALEELPSGWRLGGIAEFEAPSGLSRLEYTVECDREWRTVRARVRGMAGARPLELAIRRDATDDWHIGPAPIPALRGLVDLDLGFTPATNLFPLRRLALEPGQSAGAEAAWLDDEAWEFRRLPQRYERRGEREYWYESPSAGYAAMLTVTAEGFVSDYPGLWSAA